MLIPKYFHSLLMNYRLMLRNPYALGGSARHYQTFFSLFFYFLVRMTNPR